ncbi:MAG: radical SAM protein [Methanosphaera sp. rholeuAM74]|nr:MAG: radical SAM protein [Methanosphaera sp. rholeuAM74]
MNSKITEIFSSIQGEGKYIGKRQVFIRFSGCNINCNYCDTLDSKNTNEGTYYSIDELNDKILSLMSPDFHSLEITGGEPLLHAPYIKEFLSKYNYKSMLETNASMPNNLKLLKDVIDIVSMDIKLPEHFDSIDEWVDVYTSELKSVEIAEEEKMEYYIKIVVSPTTPSDVIERIMEDLSNISSDVTIILQPMSPIELWADKSNLFKLSELVAKYYDVSIIPQMHKYLGVN